MNEHTLKSGEVLKKLKTDPKRGLSKTEAKTRLIKYGKNSITYEKSQSFLRKFFAQFSDFMVIILITAASVSFITSVISKSGDYIDTIIILGIVIINAFIGVLQESKAEKEITSLKKLATPLAKVIRNGKKQLIACEEVVPGDILDIGTGDLICADARVIESSNLAAEESSITGESLPIDKSEKEVCPQNAQISERKNMLFTGSIINRGNAKAVVVATGTNTEVGKVEKIVNAEPKIKTPLQAKLSVTGKITSICIIAVSVAVFILGILQKIDFMEMFMISISLAVAAIPEGLPAVVTIVLANGVRRMAKKNTIVRNLPAVETLGHASVICSDKTGTLTLNKMTLREIRNYTKSLDFKSDFSKFILTLGTLCNNSETYINSGEIKANGEPTENALIIAAAENNITKKFLSKKYVRILELPFDSSRKLMSVVYKHNSEYEIITKGAPEILLKKCSHYYTENGIFPINEEILQSINKNSSEMASKAMRVLGIAYKYEKEIPSDYIGATEKAENNLIFVGLFGIIDPPRPEAKMAVAECKKAGIKPIMITGDSPETAKAIAEKVGVLSKNSKTITGAELSKISDTELKNSVSEYCVFARVSPEHKVRIVKAFQENENIVAMTGDGVNDAPALKIANIGCAMGKSGTDAAKSASDMIITDDNFATIVEAVKQGRGIFENIKKTIHFLLSTNIGEVMVVLLGFLMRLPPPLLAIHLLWINLVTDAFPALALGVDPIDKNIMNRKPLDPQKSLFAGGLGYNIIIEGMFIASMGFLSYSIGRCFFDIDPLHPIIGQTMAFLTLGLSQLIHAFNVQSRKSLFITGFFSNLKLIFAVLICTVLEVITVTVPAFTNFFKTYCLNVLEWFIVIFLSLLPLLISELEKYLESKEIKIYKKNT